MEIRARPERNTSYETNNFEMCEERRKTWKSRM